MSLTGTSLAVVAVLALQLDAAKDPAPPAAAPGAALATPPAVSSVANVAAPAASSVAVPVAAAALAAPRAPTAAQPVQAPPAEVKPAEVKPASPSPTVVATVPPQSGRVAEPDARPTEPRRPSNATLESVIALAEQPAVGSEPFLRDRRERAASPAHDDVERVGDTTRPGDPVDASRPGSAATTTVLPKDARALLRESTRDDVDGHEKSPALPSTGLIVGLLFIALGGLALMRVTRRSGAPSRLVHVVERVPTGRGRELLLVQVGGDYMLLSSTAGGTTVVRDNVRVASRDAGARDGEGREAVRRSRDASADVDDTPRAWSFFARVGEVLRGRARSTSSSFSAMLDEDELVQESTEDAEIRRKVMQRMSGVGREPSTRTGPSM
jgi:hypothetical protein